MLYVKPRVSAPVLVLTYNHMGICRKRKQSVSTSFCKKVGYKLYINKQLKKTKISTQIISPFIHSYLNQPLNVYVTTAPDNMRERNRGQQRQCLNSDENEGWLVIKKRRKNGLSSSNIFPKVLIPCGMF